MEDSGLSGTAGTAGEGVAASLPKWTQRMTMHLNGGGFSVLAYDVLADGKRTGITHTIHTNGSPKYLVDSDTFNCPPDTFDALATKRKGLTDWLNAHRAVSAETSGPAEAGEAL